MKTRSLPACRGWYWFFEGLALLRKSRWIFSALVFFCWWIFTVLSAAHVAGKILVLLSLPAVSVCLMNTWRLIDTRVPLPFFAVLLSGFRTNTRAIFYLGLVSLLLTLLIFMTTSWIDGGFAFRFMVLGELASEIPSEVAKMRESSLILSSVLTMTLMALMSLLLWFASALAAWQGFSASNALLFSLMAVLRNALPFLRYALTLFLFGLLLPLLVISLAMIGLDSNDMTPIEALCFLIAAQGSFIFLILTLILSGSIYAAYRDIFIAD